jgi:thiopurine S-methyltransferase
VEQVVGVEASSIAMDEFSEENPEFSVVPKASHYKDSNFLSYHSANDKIMFKVGDFFDANSQQLEGRFDVIYDRASMVAITPNLRQKYMDVINELLKQDGKILLVTVDRRSGKQEAVDGGPPYSINEAQVRALYSSKYHITKISEEDMTNHPSSSKFIESGVTSFFEITFLLQRKSEEECGSS